MGAENFYKYPYTGPIGSTTLIGSKLIVGTRTKLTERMVNNFNIGDEFHKSKMDSYYPIACLNDDQGYYSLMNENLIIKSKLINNQSDTVIYNTQLCSKKTIEIEYSKVNYVAFNDSIILKLPYRNIGNIPLKVYLPNPIEITMSGVTVHKTISTLIIRDGLYFEDYFDFLHGCFNNNWYADTAITLDCYEPTPDHSITCGNQIIEGTGYGYNYSRGECSYSSKCLNYFKKGSVTWGTPNNFNCDTLTVRTILGINEANLQKSITISPNPFSEIVNIKSDSRIQNVNIYNLQMQLIKVVQSINSKDVILNLDELPSGLYIAEVILADHRKAQHKIIKSD